MSDNLNFEFLGGPIDNPDEDGKVFEILGRAAVSWARLEQQVEAILLHINKEKYSEYAI